MSKLLFQFLIVLTAQSQLIAQKSYHNTQPDNQLVWKSNYLLTWQDFEGTPESHSMGDAGTAVKIKAQPYQVKRKMFYEINAIFLKDKSWYREQSPSLLAHEQLHFDIAELYARKARKKVKELAKRGVKDLKTYNNEVNKILNESNYVDQQYDAETLHGSMTKKQLEWKNKVMTELKALESYPAGPIAL